ncbi:MAG: L,D-transpeptidase [Pseudonocardia sp.]
MSDFRTRRRLSHQHRIAVVFTAALVGLGVVFTGIGNADEADADRDGGLGSAAPLTEAERYYTRPDDGRAQRPEREDRAVRAERERRAERDREARAERDRRADQDEDREASDERDADDYDDTGADDERSDDELYVPDELADELVPGTPCTKRAVACVSIGAKKSWLFKKDELGNTVIDRTATVSTGGPGRETPLGDFVVEWKHKDHRSSEYFAPHGCKPGTPGCLGAPMNWAVFFAQGGIAFHEGTLNQRSSGCVRLNATDAEYYYTTLKLGDKVEVRA